MPAEVIQSQYDELKKVAERFGRQAESQKQLQQRIAKSMSALQNDWQGKGSAAFFAEMDGKVLPVMKRMESAFVQAQRTATEIQQIVSAAEEDAAKPFKGGEKKQIALGPPLAPHAQTINSFSNDRTDWRTSRDDRRTDRRIRTDERWRRTPGNTGSGHFDSDWAGRTILERYLTGGGDLTINNDPRWTEYMQANSTLTDKLGGMAVNEAEQLHQQFIQKGVNSTTFNNTMSMEIENGEGIVGYQYLHGTNANAGGFQRSGNAQITPDGQGGYLVNIKTSYTWNDIIDPNPQYSTDNWKSTVAEILTLGQADAYEIHITWTENTTLRLDENGKVTSIQNNR